jgi:hypothetical protein
LSSGVVKGPRFILADGNIFPLDHGNAFEVYRFSLGRDTTCSSTKIGNREAATWGFTLGMSSVEGMRWQSR